MKSITLIVCLIFSTFYSYGQKDSWYPDTLISFNHYQYVSSPNEQYLSPYSGNYFSGLFPLTFQSRNRYELLQVFQAPGEYIFQDSLKELAASQVVYQGGYSERQSLRVVHQQHLAKQEFLFGFYSNRSVGVLSNQGLDHNALQLGFRGEISSRLSYHVNARGGKYKQQINGGLTADSVLEQQIQQFNLLPVNLSSAAETFFQRKVNARLNYGLGKIMSKDSVPRLLGYKHQLFISNSYKREARLFEDQFPDSDYYNAIISDSSETFDSTSIARNVTSFGTEFRSDKLDVIAALNYGYTSFYSNEAMGSWVQPSFLIEATVKPIDKFETKLHFEKFIGGSTPSDFDFTSSSCYSVRKGMSLYGDFSISSQTANPIYSEYAGNHNFWSQNLQAEKSQLLSVGLKAGNLKLSAFSRNIGGYLYFNKLQPVQLAQDLSINGLDLSYEFKYKSLEGLSQLKSQFASTNQVILSPLVSRQMLAIGFKLFPEKIPFKLIVDHYGFQTPDALTKYDAALGMFLPDQGVNNDYGFVQKLDVTIAVRISTARVFVRAENILDLGFIQQQIYSQGFMLNPFSVRLGLSWRVFD